MRTFRSTNHIVTVSPLPFFCLEKLRPGLSLIAPRFFPPPNHTYFVAGLALSHGVCLPERSADLYIQVLARSTPRSQLVTTPHFCFQTTLFGRFFTPRISLFSDDFFLICPFGATKSSSFAFADFFLFFKRYHTIPTPVLVCCRFFSPLLPTFLFCYPTTCCPMVSLFLFGFPPGCSAAIRHGLFFYSLSIPNPHLFRMVFRRACPRVAYVPPPISLCLAGLWPVCVHRRLLGYQ